MRLSVQWSAAGGLRFGLKELAHPPTADSAFKPNLRLALNICPHIFGGPATIFEIGSNNTC